MDLQERQGCSGGKRRFFTGLVASKYEQRGDGLVSGTMLSAEHAAGHKQSGTVATQPCLPAALPARYVSTSAGTAAALPDHEFRGKDNLLVLVAVRVLDLIKQ